MLAEATSTLRGRVPAEGIAQLVAGLARHPGEVVGRLRGFAGELASIG
jgi:hypothetical protein